jgi:hypothetical protein
MFAVGDLVEVQHRSWANVNKEGGVARITRVHELLAGVSYDLTHLIGNSRKECAVDEKWISLHDAAGSSAGGGRVAVVRCKCGDFRSSCHHVAGFDPAAAAAVAAAVARSPAPLTPSRVAPEATSTDPAVLATNAELLRLAYGALNGGYDATASSTNTKSAFRVALEEMAQREQSERPTAPKHSVLAHAIRRHTVSKESKAAVGDYIVSSLRRGSSDGAPSSRPPSSAGRGYCSSAYRGVYRREGGKWQAQVHHGGKKVHVGSYESEDEAARAYDAEAFALKGGSALLNFPNGDVAAAVGTAVRSPPPRATGVAPEAASTDPAVVATNAELLRLAENELAARNDATGSSTNTKSAFRVALEEMAQREQSEQPTAPKHNVLAHAIRRHTVSKESKAAVSAYIVSSLRGSSDGAAPSPRREAVQAHAGPAISPAPTVASQPQHSGIVRRDQEWHARVWHLSEYVPAGAYASKAEAVRAYHAKAHELNCAGAARGVPVAEPALLAPTPAYALPPACSPPRNERNLNFSGGRKHEHPAASSANGSSTASSDPSNTKSAFRGITWRKDAKKWVAQMPHGGKMVTGGYYALEEDAARAYDVLVRKHRGAGAFLNFPDDESAAPGATAAFCCKDGFELSHDSEQYTYRGVSKDERRGEELCWRAWFRLNGRDVHVGMFGSEREAAAARLRALLAAERADAVRTCRSQPEALGVFPLWRSEHNDACEKCDRVGDLLCCSFCNLAFHPRCAGLTKAPPRGEWACPHCVEQLAREKGAGSRGAQAVHSTGSLDDEESRLSASGDEQSEEEGEEGEEEQVGDAAAKGTQGHHQSPSSDFRGVSWSKDTKLEWHARVMYRGKTLSLGHFPTQEQAARAYDAKASELKGMEAILNFPEDSQKGVAAKHGRASLAPGASASDMPGAKRARYTVSDDEEARGGDNILAWENRDRFWAEVAERNRQIAALIAHANAKRDARLAAQAEEVQVVVD